MSVYLKTWKRQYFKANPAVITSLVIVTFFTVIHLNVWFTFGYREVDENGTVTEYCHSDKTPTLGWMNLWSLVGKACQSPHSRDQACVQSRFG